MSTSKMIILLIVIYLLLSCAAGGDVILKPIRQVKQEVALVFIQGAQIQTNQYLPVVSQIQASSEYSLWVGIPQYSLDIAEPLVIGDGITRVLEAMRSQGMSNTACVFVAGHSLGGAILQDYINGNPSNITGQILMGSFLERKYNGQKYPVPTLTIGGELDGLCHLTRIMESFYHYVLHPNPNSFPVVLKRGMSHMQFASGDPPFLVKERDLKPEITEKEAHEFIGNVTASFIASLLSEKDKQEYINALVTETGTFFVPLLKAYEMEGFYYFKPPCYDNPPSPACTTGCPWAEIAQPIMGGLVNNVVDRDAFHPVYQINPIHLPKILNNCSTFNSSCILNTTTVSQCVYEIVDEKLDTGFFATSASEIRTKLSSRQNIMESAGMGKLDFNKTDGGSICKTINEKCYEWAKANVGAATLARFNKLGEPLVFGEDKGPYNAGPLWIYTPLEYKRITDENGNTFQQIRSPMMRTPTNYFIKLAAGFHYCKLLSPARAMEWMYVDGLRLHDSLNNSTSVA